MKRVVVIFAIVAGIGVAGPSDSPGSEPISQKDKGPFT